MVFMPFCNTKPNGEWRYFKAKTCVSHGFAGSGTLGNTCTLSSHCQLHSDLQPTEGSAERIQQSHDCGQCFSELIPPGRVPSRELQCMGALAHKFLLSTFCQQVNGRGVWLQIKLWANEITELEDNNCSGVRGLICVTKGRRHGSPTKGSAKADCK